MAGICGLIMIKVQKRGGTIDSIHVMEAMPKNAQTTTQLHSSHTLAKKCSKFSKPGFKTR